MPVHVIHSPAWGELRITAEQVPADEQGRTWRARLTPGRRELGHVAGVLATSEEEAVAGLVRYVEAFDVAGYRRPPPAPGND